MPQTGCVWRHEFAREPGLVVLRVYGTATAEGMAKTLRALEAEYRSWTERQAIAFDLSEMESIGAAERAQVAEFRKRHPHLIADSVVRAAYLVPGPLLRGALTAITWIKPSPVEVRVFDSLDRARGWLLRGG